MRRLWGNKRVRENVGIVVELAVIFAVLFALCWPYEVEGGSMLPGIEDGDRVVICRAGVWLGKVRRGDVVAARNPYGEPKRILKRVAGLPGDTVGFVGDSAVLVRGVMYTVGGFFDISAMDMSYDVTGSVTLGAGEYFLLGDNFGDSLDSRAFGAVSGADIIGVQFGRVWPFGRAYVRVGGGGGGLR